MLASDFALQNTTASNVLLHINYMHIHTLVYIKLFTHCSLYVVGCILPVRAEKFY